MSPSTRLTQIAPIFPVSDLRRALAHYDSLGFETLAYAGGDDYGFVERDGVQLHLARCDDHDPHCGSGAAYLYVEDADSLFAAWGRPGILGTTLPPGDTPYKLREGSHVDPDGNLIRFGSPLPHLVRLHSHVASHYGIAITETTELDVGVFRLRRPDGPSWVARVFPAARSIGATSGDATVLHFLAAHAFPAERLAAPDPLSVLDGQSVLVTEYLEPVPRQERRAPSHEGGAWHHLADGGPPEEIAASIRLLHATVDRLPAEDRGLCAALRQELDRLDDGDGLPRALVHPDFVLANVVASRDRGLVLVDWTGAGRAARAWSLAFLLFAEGTKNLARVDLVVAGYRRHIDPEPEELSRLPALLRARPVTLGVWSLCQGRQTVAETLAQVSDITERAEAIAARARTAIGTTRLP